MKTFLIKILIFIFLLLCSFYFIFNLADGKTDSFYLRFTSSRQNSLIIGTSRAAQGMQPDILNKFLLRSDIYNYAFTLGQSPFGPIYLESIKKKLKTNANNGIFLIAVDPWSISSITDNPDDVNNFRETNRILHLKYVNLKPNIFYLLKYYDNHFINLMMKSKHSRTTLHNNGWLEVDIKKDHEYFKKRTEKKIKIYRNKVLPKYKYSSVRYEYLKKTIEFLNEYGEVYIIRLPVHDKMLDIENILMPDFDKKLNDLCKSYELDYLNMTESTNNYIYTDGNHLYKKSGELVSKEIANWIINIDKKYAGINN